MKYLILTDTICSLSTTLFMEESPLYKNKLGAQPIRRQHLLVMLIQALSLDRQLPISKCVGVQKKALHEVVVFLLFGLQPRHESRGKPGWTGACGFASTNQDLRGPVDIPQKIPWLTRTFYSTVQHPLSTPPCRNWKHNHPFHTTASVAQHSWLLHFVMFMVWKINRKEDQLKCSFCCKKKTFDEHWAIVILLSNQHFQHWEQPFTDRMCILVGIYYIHAPSSQHAKRQERMYEVLDMFRSQIPFHQQMTRGMAHSKSASFLVCMKWVSVRAVSKPAIINQSPNWWDSNTITFKLELCFQDSWGGASCCFFGWLRSNSFQCILT